MRRRLLSVLVATAAALTTTVVLAPPAPADTLLGPRTPLPLSWYADHVVDLEQQRIYFVPGPGDDRLVVTDLEGRVVDSRDGLAGSDAIAVSPDGASLVVVPETNRIVILDASSLEVSATYELPVDMRVHDVAWVSSAVWFTASMGWGSAHLHALDLGTGEHGRVAGVEFTLTGSLIYEPTSGVALMQDYQSGSVVAVDPTSGQATHTRSFGGNSRSLSLSANGLPSIITSDAVEMRLVVFDPSTLATVRTTRAPTNGWRGAVTTDGQVVTGFTYAGNESVEVTDASTSERINRWRIPYPTDASRVVETILTPAGLLVVALHDNSLETYLVRNPSETSSDIEFHVPSGAFVGRENVLSGVLTDDGEPVAGAEIRISDIPGFPGTGPERTRVVTTDSEGAFSFAYTPRTWNDHLTFEYDGDDEHAPAWHGVHGYFELQPTALEVNDPPTPSPGDEVTFTGSLTALGEPVAQADIRVTQNCSSEQPVTLLTAADGTFNFVAVPGRCRTDWFAFYYAGDSTYRRVEVVKYVSPTWQASTISLRPVQDAVVDTEFEWTGEVRRNGSLAADVPVSYAISPVNTGGSIAHGTVRTDAQGRFLVEESIEHADQYHMAVRFDGDAETLGDAEVDSFVVTRIPTWLALDDTYFEVLPDEPITIGGRVTTSGGVPLADQHLTISHEWDVVASLQTDASGRFQWQTVPHPPQGWSDNGRRSYVVDVLADSRHGAARTIVGVTVAPERTVLSLDEVPEPTTAGDTVTLSGRLSTAAGVPLSGHEVLLHHSDGDENVYRPVTDADGRFAVETTLQSGYDQYLIANFAGTRLLATAYDQTGWANDPLPGSLTLDPVPTALLGEYVVLSGVLTDDEGHGESTQITVSRLDETGSVTKVFGPTTSAADGSFSLAVPAERVGRFGFVVKSTMWRVAPQSVSVSVEVRRLELDSRAVRPATTQRGWAVYDAATDPRIATIARPRRSELCLHYEVQQRVGGDWRFRALSGCRDTDDRGEARYTLGGRHPAGSEFRVRPVWGEPSSVNGSWVKVRFR